MTNTPGNPGNPPPRRRGGPVARPPQPVTQPPAQPVSRRGAPVAQSVAAPAQPPHVSVPTPVASRRGMGGGVGVPLPVTQPRAAHAAAPRVNVGAVVVTTLTPEQRREARRQNMIDIHGVWVVKGPGVGNIPTVEKDYVEDDYSVGVKRGVLDCWNRYVGITPEVIGERGFGKTSAVEHLCYELGMECFKMTGSPHTQKKDFTGGPIANPRMGQLIKGPPERVLNPDGTPKIVNGVPVTKDTWIRDERTAITNETPFVRAVKAAQKDGALVCLLMDENNRIPAEERMYTNRVEDLLAKGGGTLDIPEIGLYGLEIVPEKFKMVACGNPNEVGYTGVEAADASTARRRRDVAPHIEDPKAYLSDWAMRFINEKDLFRDYPIIERLVPDYVSFVIDIIKGLESDSSTGKPSGWNSDKDPINIRIPPMRTAIKSLKDDLKYYLDRHDTNPFNIPAQFKDKRGPGLHDEAWIKHIVMKNLTSVYTEMLMAISVTDSPRAKRMANWVVEQWNNKVGLEFKAKFEKGTCILDDRTLTATPPSTP